MATKTFNDICVEYAHQLGKGLPLTAPEMCNAVIMYLNAQITEMQGITTALQTAVAEAEESATEATNTANELSGKVDTLQTAVTEAESSATEAINKADDVSETVNALPKVPTPTTSDNGKVIGVQSGAYALVEQSGGEAPANMYTTDTAQVIDVNKGSYKTYYTNGGIKVANYRDDDLDRVVNGGIAYVPTDFEDSMIPGWVWVRSDPVRDTSSQKRNACLTATILNGDKEGFTDYGNHTVAYGADCIKVTKYSNPNDYKNWDNYYLGFPFKSGMLAVEGDIPDLDNYIGTMHIVQGTAGSGIAVHDTAKASPYTKYGYDKIETYGNSNSLQYTLNIPNKNGTIATLDDIGASGSKLYSHYITMTGNTTVGGESVTSNVTFNLITDRPNSYDFLRLINYLNRGGFAPNIPFSGYIGDDTLTGLYITYYNNNIYISCIRDNDIISIDESPSLSTILSDIVIEL